MSQFEINKSVEAVKLNKRTGIPLTEPPITIPYGAILDHVEESGDYFKFTYLTDRYQFKKDVVRGALHAIKAHGSDDPHPHEPAHRTHKTAPPGPEPDDGRPELVFEPLRTHGAGRLSRAKIPGGWLVAGGGGHIAFVPDPDHAWDGSSL